ncbi:DUF5616 domain-containing protein, partial [Candidatus Altiarchaeota archaeon]
VLSPLIHFFPSPPSDITFLFDSQISKSGELAGFLKEEMEKNGLMGKARTSRKCDHEIKKLNKITFTSDSAIIEKVDRVVDLPRHIILKYKKTDNLLSFHN